MKVAINTCYGGFDLSEKAIAMLQSLGGLCKREDDDMDDYFTLRIGEYRTDPNLIRVIEELGEEADGETAMLEIVDIPAGVEWTIEDYDGREWVAEKHRTWP